MSKHVVSLSELWMWVKLISNWSAEVFGGSLKSNSCSNHVKSGLEPSKGRKLKLKAILTCAIRDGGPGNPICLKVTLRWWWTADEIQVLNAMPKAGNKIAVSRPPTTKLLYTWLQWALTSWCWTKIPMSQALENSSCLKSSEDWTLGKAERQCLWRKLLSKGRSLLLKNTGWITNKRRKGIIKGELDAGLRNETPMDADI